MKRASGVLLPIFSLPSDYGIGDFGPKAYEFVDFLAASKQKFWQILPLVQTGLGNSPYSSVCSTSFNPLFISPSLLKEQGLIDETELNTTYKPNGEIDYDFLYKVRYALLKKAFERFDKTNKAFTSFVKKGSFRDYALFMALKDRFNQAHFCEWQKEFKYRDSNALLTFEKENQDELLFWQFIQFEGQKQWFNLKKYAFSKGIKIIGDLPLYVAGDSVDVWVNPLLYKLNEDFSPKMVAGVPPDYFCEDGQLWGNPVYDYDYHRKHGFAWWSERVANALKVYDYIRIDHFRGLDRYYEVLPTAPNAKDGEWVDVPSIELFSAIHRRANKNRIIAEDLGVIDDGVRELLKETGYPGMKILSFAFNGDVNNLYLPEILPKNCVCYTGTHDNDTLIGLIESANEWEKANLVNGVNNSLNKLGIQTPTDTNENLAKAILDLGYLSKANLFVAPIQDLLMLNSKWRINRPGVVSTDNWSVRFNSRQFTKELADFLAQMVKNSKR